MKVILNIFKHRCPRCRKGRLFEHPIYRPQYLTKMPEKCAHCSQAFHLEPSFYYGALYVSYGLQVALFAAVSLSVYLIDEESPTSWYLYGVTIAAILFFPLVIRLSRSIWIHFFVKFDPTLS